MVKAETLTIEIAYANADESYLIALQVGLGTTVEQAIVQSGVLQQCPEINLQDQSVGIFSQRVDLSYVLRDKDRIEIYRPLRIDPKEARRKRAIKPT